MVKPTSDTEPTIEALLEQRTQYEDWLAKLDASGDKAPPSVRQRVRSDYEGRLHAVMEQLRGRSAAVGEELERQHAAQAALDRERRAAEEELAEAEVRHSVGEYTEDEWRQVREDGKRKIEQLRAQLRGIGAEITRLTEVQNLIGGPRTAAGLGGGAAPPAPVARPEIVEEAPLVTHVAEPIEEPDVIVPSPRPVPKPPLSEVEPVGAPVDELTFLKSVAEEEPRPPGRRVSNPGMTAPTATSPAPPAAAVGKAPAGVAKTLKCSDCGTLNRPTEWYCERCGAELAGV